MSSIGSVPPVPDQVLVWLLPEAAASAALMTLYSYARAATSATLVAPSISALVSAASSICSR